jgi:chromosome segregation ATPase
LANSEAQLRSSAAAQETSQAQIETEAENNALKEKLHQNEMRMHSLEARNAELERTLTAAEQSFSEFNDLRTRLEQAERNQHGLREEVRQREQQLVQSQARAAEAEAHRQRLAALQTPYHALLSKQASLAEKQRELQADLEAFARLMDHSET